MNGRGYLLDVEPDLVGGLNTPVVVPMFPRLVPIGPARRLTPVYRVGDADCVMATRYLVAVPVGLSKPSGASLSAAPPARHL